MAWTVQEAQDRADRYGWAGCHPERSIREAAASVAADVHQRTFLPGDAIEESYLIPFGGDEIRVALPPSWCGDPFVLQFVIEDQLREHSEAKARH